MKYLILSDIHGNLEALQAVMEKVKSEEIDKYVVLGDLVGYGADPNAVVEIIRGMDPIFAIRGNHDRVAAGLSDGSDFNYAARDAALWTREKLTAENRDYIAGLSQGPGEVDGLFQTVHGAPWDEDHYIFDWKDVWVGFQKSDSRIIFFGHTHMSVLWSLNERELNGEPIFDNHFECSLEEDKRYLINPGSVGQPRDGNPKSGFAILDSDEMKVHIFRVEYNIKSTQNKILRAGLDDYLADRLISGK
jgi:predicted phosphodiesterase